MVDGFGLDIVAKLTLAHSSDDSALSGSRHTDDKSENVINAWNETVSVDDNILQVTTIYRDDKLLATHALHWAI